MTVANGIGPICLALALALPVCTVSSVQAQNTTLNSDEIVRRLELQAQGLAAKRAAGSAEQTRGMRFNYGQANELPATSETENAAAESFVPDTVQPDLTSQPGETTPQPLTGDPVDLFYPKTQTDPPSGHATFVEVTQPADTNAELAAGFDAYRPVQEAARIDLRIYFEWNSAALRPEAIVQLSELCSAVRQVTGSRHFKIIGHTDKSGDDAYNLYLSQARAREVKRHLVEECAIPESALLATGEGERQSDPNSPERAPDERLVEFQLVG